MSNNTLPESTGIVIIGGVPGGAGSESLAFKNDYVGDTAFCQVVGDGAACDTAADDDDAGAFGKCVVAHLIFLN